MTAGCESGLGEVSGDTVVRFRPGRDEMPGPPGGMGRRETGRQGAVRAAALLVGRGGIDGGPHERMPKRDPVTLNPQQADPLGVFQPRSRPLARRVVSVSASSLSLAAASSSARRASASSRSIRVRNARSTLAVTVSGSSSG